MYQKKKNIRENISFMCMKDTESKYTDSHTFFNNVIQISCDTGCFFFASRNFTYLTSCLVRVLLCLFHSKTRRMHFWVYLSRFTTNAHASTICMRFYCSRYCCYSHYKNAIICLHLLLFYYRTCTSIDVCAYISD